MKPYEYHLKTSEDLVTTYEATRSGFITLALEKNRRASPYVMEARALQQAALLAKNPADLLNIQGIQAGLLTAAGVSDKALKYLLPQDKQRAVSELIKNFLEPAGEKFVEELVFRFLLTRGDALGGSIRNIGGWLAQRKLTCAILSTLAIAGTPYQWQHAKSRAWLDRAKDDCEIEMSLRGITWYADSQPRTLIYNLNVPVVQNNVDFCLFGLSPTELESSKYQDPMTYLALGELKGGIDPAGADEHWKTARTALTRIRTAFSEVQNPPHTFFVGAAIQTKMAKEIWNDLHLDILSNAANLTDEKQVASISRWLCNL